MHRSAMAGAAMMLAAGCGAAASPDYHPPLAEVHGTVLATQQAPATSPRAAIVWRAVSIDFFKLLGQVFGTPIEGASYQVRSSTADVPVSTSLPARYRIRIESPPPREALLDLGEAKLALSFGAVVFYDDLDGNESLSIDEAGGTGADRILGAAAPLVLAVENLDPAVPTGSPNPTGFHLVRSRAGAVPLPCNEPEPPLMSELLPIDTTLDVVLGGQPLPAGLCPPIASDPLCRPTPGDTVTCNADGSGWLVQPPTNGALCPARSPCSFRVTCPATTPPPDFCRR